MPFLTPQIIYDAGSGSVTVAPTYPDVSKPYMDPLEALRHDSITSSGLRQTMVERVDTIRNIVFDSVPWSDLPMWAAFFAYAIQGGSFYYYPDATATAFQTFELVDDKVTPQIVSRGMSKLAFKIRLVPGGLSSP